jgi:hypothetical protein
MHKITWIGENNEYLNIGKRKASLQKGKGYRELNVIKYVKNRSITLSQTHLGEKFLMEYDIMRLTKDTLILAPKGDDIFVLSEANKQNQYVFVNSMLTYKFVELYYETSFYNFDNPKERLQFILYIDSTKRSKVVVKDESYNEGSMYTASPSKVEYERLIKILSSCDIGCIPEENMVVDDRYPYTILEISNNNKVKAFKGFNRLPANCADELADFVCDYIELRANINAKWGWRVYIHQRK